MHSKGKFWATFWHDCHLQTSCIAVQMLLNQNQPLQVIAFSTIGYLWAAQHELPIIKIFIPDFFTVNLFPAPLDRILCHAQFTIEAQSLDKRSELPSSVLLLQLVLHRVCTWISYCLKMTQQNSQRPYHVEHTSSRPITEVKQRWA